MRAARHLCAGTAFALAFGLAAPAGAEVASGWRSDFAADGVADLVIGVPGAGRDEPGEVRVLYGTPDGLSVAEAEVWNLDSPGVAGESGGDLRCCFGLSLL